MCSRNYLWFTRLKGKPDSSDAPDEAPQPPFLAFFDHFPRIFLPAFFSLQGLFEMLRLKRGFDGFYNDGKLVGEHSVPEISKITTIHSSSDLTGEESERILKLIKGNVSHVR